MYKNGPKDFEQSKVQSNVYKTENLVRHNYSLCVLKKASIYALFFVSFLKKQQVNVTKSLAWHTQKAKEEDTYKYMSVKLPPKRQTAHVMLTKILVMRVRFQTKVYL